MDDNAALYHILKSNYPVIPIFIFDINILNQLEDKKNAQVHFIHQSLLDLQDQLTVMGSNLEVYHGTPETTFLHLLKNIASKMYTLIPTTSTTPLRENNK